MTATKEIKWGRYTETEIKKKCPDVKKLKARINKDTPNNRRWFGKIQINVLQFIASQLFYFPQSREANKSDLIDFFLKKEVRPNFVDPYHPKNKPHMPDDALQGNDIANAVKNTKRQRRAVKSSMAGKNKGTKKGGMKKQPVAVQNNIPVRRCGQDCDHINNCKHYVNGKVKGGDMCVEDIDRVEKWIIAFKNKNPEELTENAGLLCGILELQVIEMANQVRKDGVMLEIIKTDNFGNPVYDKNTGDAIVEKVTHPLLKDITRIVSTMKINLPEYLMSPKSKGEQTVMEGNIKVQKKIDLDKALEEQKTAYAKLEDAMKRASNTRSKLENERKDELNNNNRLNVNEGFTKAEINELPMSIRDTLISDELE